MISLIMLFPVISGHWIFGFKSCF